MNKKITCIEGLRTIGWLGIFISHFRGSMLPNVHWATDDTPIRFIYSGNAYVRLLFVISGFVISYKYFVKEKYENIFVDIIKRYFRLMPPVLVSELLVFILMKIHALRNAEVAILTGSKDFLGLFNQFEPNILECLKEALFTTYLNGANGYIGPLWTMVYEYLGAILILCSIYIVKKTPWRWLFYAIFLTFFNGYYNYFVIGMLICDIYVSSYIESILKAHKTVHFFVTVVGYVMLSMVNISDTDKFSRVVFGIGIVLFMIGLLYSSCLEKILGNPLMIRGGKIAYSAYIIHWPLIETVSCGSFLLLFDKITSYSLMIGIVFFVTLLYVIIAATFLEKYVEQIGMYIGKNIFSSIE